MFAFKQGKMKTPEQPVCGEVLEVAYDAEAAIGAAKMAEGNTTTKSDSAVSPLEFVAASTDISSSVPLTEVGVSSMEEPVAIITTSSVKGKMYRSLKKERYSFNHNKKTFNRLERLTAFGAVAACLALAVWGVMSLFNICNVGYCIAADGLNTDVVVGSKAQGEMAVELYIDNMTAKYGYDIVCQEDVSFKKVSLKDKTVINPDQAALALNQCLTPLVAAAVINVGGTPRVAVASQEVAETVLAKVKAYYADKAEKVLDVNFSEDVTIVAERRSPEIITSAEVAKNILLFGDPTLAQHIVVSSDETLWSIAKQYGLDIETLTAANPGVTSENLELGMNIKLSAPSPAVSVVVVKEITETQPVQYSTTTRTTSGLARGTTKVVTPGNNGEKEVVSKVTEINGVQIDKAELSATIISAPVAQVVEKGTNILMASRSGSGGFLAWPLRGEITSRYGGRSRGFHTGVDIDGEVGDPVRAADGGKVVFSGWSGSYGNLVKISHGDGLETWYAHCSKLLVDVGDQVGCGTTIAKVGNTGNSTGSHLHFEVQVDGKTYNPLNYLK